MEIVKLLTRPNHKALPYLQVLLLACAVITTIPNLIMDISLFDHLDTSWMIGLHKANIQGMIHGKDIVFTYGPLGFLTLPMFISRNQWLCSAIYILSAYVLVLFSFSLYVRKTKASLVDTIILTVIFIAVFRAYDSACDFGLPLSALIFSYLYVQGKRRPLLLPGLAFLYSILPFIKFSSALMVFTTGTAFCVVLVWDKRYKEAFLFMISILFALVMLSLMLLKSPNAAVMFFHGCLQISSGYSDG